MPAKPRVLTKKEDLFKWYFERKRVNKYAYYGIFVFFYFLVFLEINAYNDILSIYFLAFLPVFLLIVWYITKYEIEKRGYYDFGMMQLVKFFKVHWSLIWRKRENFLKLAPVFKKGHTTPKEIMNLVGVKKNHADMFLLELVALDMARPTTKADYFVVDKIDPIEAYKKVNPWGLGKSPPHFHRFNSYTVINFTFIIIIMLFLLYLMLRPMLR